ncbi:unnamed protein product [Toxocara canis]|uniref:Uncharacterized protein n=1 Tax=Toxocara canis TaxID=6265 RepID=A0A183VAY3_TOXCA|nr:unnamed protein product [Toxocara canis]
MLATMGGTAPQTYNYKSEPKRRRVHWSTGGEPLDTSIAEEMDRLGSLTLPDFGIHNDDVHYFYIDSVISGRGPDRLKYLDLEGRWKLSNRSVPYINSAFRHLERLNDAQRALREFTDQPLNAIGFMGWTPSEPLPKKEEKPLVIIRPESAFKEQLPPSPRESVPHRSAGYGPAHQKRKLSVPDRARSPITNAQSPILITDYDKYAKYQFKDHSLKSNSKGDLGYSSADERNTLETPSPRPDKTMMNEAERPPHRTQTLTARHSTKWQHSFISDYEPTNVNRVNLKQKKNFIADRRYGDDLTISVKETTKQLPYRSGGYGSPHLHRQYEISPRSVGYSSAYVFSLFSSC